MSDIVTRLRRWVHAVDAVPASDLMDEAATGIELLRVRVGILETAIRRLAEQDATLSVIGGNIIIDVDSKLTAEERAALVSVVNRLCGLMTDEERKTLAAMVERLG